MKSSLQKILVPLDLSEYAAAATRAACEVAKVHGGEVTGLVVLDTPDIRSSVTPAEVTYWPVVQDAIHRATDDARERIAEARREFADVCERQGVSHRESQLEGIPSHCILDAAVLFDLVVMGLRTYFHFETRPGPGNSLARVLDRTPTPVLAVPAELPPDFKKCLIAYDGSYGAGRALRDFVSFAKGSGAREITVLTAGQDERQSAFLQESAAAYLNAHGFDDFALVTTEAPAIEVVMDEYAGSTDLIVAGIHSRRILKDIFVGSFTTELIEDGRIALFLSH